MKSQKWWGGKLIRRLPSPPWAKPSSQQKRKRKQKSANEHDNEQKHHECTLYTTYLVCILMLAWSWYKELKKITWKLEREKNLKIISTWAMCLNKNEKAMCLKNENTKKQNEMELEPDLCEKIHPVPIIRSGPSNSRSTQIQNQDPVLIPFLEPDQNLNWVTMSIRVPNQHCSGPTFPLFGFQCHSFKPTTC